MAVRNDLAPLPVVKTWSKRLSKAWTDVTQTPKPSLATCQEVMARVLGHSNWQSLLECYQTPSSPPSGPSLDDTMTALEKAVSLGAYQLQVTFKDAQATFEAIADSQKVELQVLPRERALASIASVYNLSMHGPEVVFQPDNAQEGQIRVVLNGIQHTLFYTSTPFFNGDIQVKMDLVAHGPAHTPALELNLDLDFQRGHISIAAAPTDSLQREMTARLALGIAKEKTVLVISDHDLPQLEGHPRIRVVSLTMDLDCFELQRALRRNRGMGHEVLVLHHESIMGGWGKVFMDKEPNIPCIATVRAADCEDVLMQLHQHQQLKEWLEYRILNHVMVVNSRQRLTSPKVLSLDDAMRRMLLSSTTLEYRRVLSQHMPD